MKYLLGLLISLQFILGSIQAQEIGKTRGSYISLNKSQVSQTKKAYLNTSNKLNLSNSSEKWLPKATIPRVWDQTVTVNNFDFNEENSSPKVLNNAIKELERSPWDAGLEDITVTRKGKGILEHRSTDWGSAEPPRKYRFFIKSHYLWRPSNMMYLQNAYPITGVTSSIDWYK